MTARRVLLDGLARDADIFERASVTLADAAMALLRALDDGGAWPDVTAAWSAVEQSRRARMCSARSP